MAMTPIKESEVIFQTPSTMKQIDESEVIFNSDDATARPHFLGDPERTSEALNIASTEPVDGATGDASSIDEAAMSGAQVLSQAMDNLGPSAVQFATDIIQPIISPVETWENFKGLGRGVYQLFTPGRQPDEAKAEAVGKFFSDRYGGWENIKRTMATDPVGFLSDLSLIISGGGLLAEKLPQATGKLTSVAQKAATKTIKKAGQLTDPIQMPGEVIRGTAAVAAASKIPYLGTAADILKAATVDLPAHVIGVTSGASGDALKIAAEAGRRGGEYAKTFLDHINNKVPIENVIDIAKAAVDELKTQRQATYLSRQAKMKKLTKPIDFGDIDKGLDGLESKGKFGEIEVRGTEPGKVLNNIKRLVNEFKKRDPAQYHTPIALDALKQAIYKQVQDLPYGSTSREIGMESYNIVKKSINESFPEYGKMMKDYEKMSGLIDELERTFNLSPGQKGVKETAIRKLTSAMRNNVNTGWGRRSDLVKILSQTKAGRTLPAALAGRATEPLMPRGIIRAGAAPLAAIVANAPSLLLGAPIFSPHLAGRAAHALGANRGKLSQALFQTGRTSQVSDPSSNRRELVRALTQNMPARSR